MERDLYIHPNLKPAVERFSKYAKHEMVVCRRMIGLFGVGALGLSAAGFGLAVEGSVPGAVLGASAGCAAFLVAIKYHHLSERIRTNYEKTLKHYKGKIRSNN